METDTKKQVFTEKEKKEALASSIYLLSEQEPFLSGLIQEINIRYSEEIPTAAIFYDKKKDDFNMIVNPGYFIPMDIKQQKAILSHEILHFSNGHLFRGFFQKGDKPTEQEMKDARVDNIAADMAINQYIPDLPEGCIYPELFKTSNGETFPKFKSFEVYKELLQQHRNQEQPDPNNPGQSERPKLKKGQEYRNENEDKLQSMMPLDSHDWAEGLTDEEKQKLLDEAKRVIKRTIEKTSYSHSRVPDGIKDLLEELETAAAALDYKNILKRAIRKTVSVADRASTWKRPNKRYGVYAPGTKNGDLPMVAFLGDTSGSISHVELNQGLRIIDEFLRIGSKKCYLGLWHTDLYKFGTYRLGDEFDKSEVQSGGTDVGPALRKVEEKNFDLTLIYTDGYFDAVDVDIKGEVVWLITENGNVDHPMKHLGVTIPIEGLKD